MTEATSAESHTNDVDRWNDIVGGRWALNRPKIMHYSPPPLFDNTLKEGETNEDLKKRREAHSKSQRETYKPLPPEAQTRDYVCQWKREIAEDFAAFLNEIPGVRAELTPAHAMVPVKRNVKCEFPPKERGEPSSFATLMRRRSEPGIAKGMRTITIETLLEPETLLQHMLERWEKSKGAPLAAGNSFQHAFENSRHKGLQLHTDFLSTQFNGRWSSQTISEHDPKTHMPRERQTFRCTGHNESEKKYLKAATSWLHEHGYTKATGAEGSGYYSLTLHDKDVRKLETAIKKLLHAEKTASQPFDTLEQRICADRAVAPGFLGNHRNV